MIRRIGPVEVVADLGVGAGSRVLRVRREADGREYALKVVSAAGPARKYLDQLRNEYRVGRLLAHPALVRVECLEVTSDWLWRPTGGRLLLEYVPGATLDRAAPLPLSTLVRALGWVAAGLAHMHARGLVHADVKPNNILVGPGGARLIDFGLSRPPGTRPGRLQGTPEYMAPEVAATGVAGERGDVFGFAATAYRVLTGIEVPTTAGLPVGPVLYRRRLRPVAELRPDCPPELATLVRRGLEYDPSARPRSMAEVHAALVELAAG